MLQLRIMQLPGCVFENTRASCGLQLVCLPGFAFRQGSPNVLAVAACFDWGLLPATIAHSRLDLASLAPIKGSPDGDTAISLLAGMAGQ